MDERTIQEHESNAIQDCLNRIFDLVEAGWANPGGQLCRGDLTLVDTRYQTKACSEAIKARGGGTPKSKILGIQSVGRSQLDARRYVAPKKRTGHIRKLGDRYHVEYSPNHRQQFLVIDVDDSKSAIQKCLRVSPGLPGALTLPLAPEKVHHNVAKHLSSEFYRRWKDPAGRVLEEWNKSGENHLLDCSGYAWVAGKHLGWRIPNTRKPQPTPKSDWLNGGKESAHAA